MRFLSFILFVGVALAMGCFLDASSPTAQAINCDNVCNAHRVIINCRFLGALEEGGGLYEPLGNEYYIPMCDTNVLGGAGCTYKVNGKTYTYTTTQQWDTSTAATGSCGLYLYQGNQHHFVLQGSTTACPCPCSPLNPPPCGGGGTATICPSVEGVYPGVIRSSVAWGVTNLNSCQ
jgi:hypothetical protein